MAGELEAIVRNMFDGVDRKDFDAVLRVTDEEVQGVDELSRKWVRGRDEVDKQWRQGLTLVEDIHTELRDVSETTFGEAGVVTCWIEQDYTIDGNAQHISGPTTILFRRRGDRWKMVLFHSIPLSEDEAQ
jgi:ketosteroid isomerase-like protein